MSVRVDEENAAAMRLIQLRAREKSLRETVAQLEHDLNSEQKQFQRTENEQKQAIAHIKEELIKLKGGVATDTRYKKKESVASVSAIWREYKLKERLFEVKLKKLEDKLQTENLVHAETKEFLVKKQHSLSEEIASWEAKYDKDVGQLDAKTNELTRERIILLEKLTILQERRQKELDAEKARKEQADFELELERQRKVDLKKQNAAAKKIQKEIRTFVKRKQEADALKEAAKKKKKGGGEGKGKGKKK